MSHLKKILEFDQLLKEFNSIQRDVESLHLKNGSDNDVEHSYRVAMLCWMIIEEYKLKLDVSKVLKYALIHDLVEVYAGDISIYLNVTQVEKEAREHKALLKLKEKYPGLASIWELVEVYEKRQDDESKFVYIIEKLEPILIVILSAEDHWIKRKISLDTFLDRKQRKIRSIDSFAHVFTKDILDFITENKKKYFI